MYSSSNTQAPKPTTAAAISPIRPSLSKKTLLAKLNFKKHTSSSDVTPLVSKALLKSRRYGGAPSVAVGTKSSSRFDDELEVANLVKVTKQAAPTIIVTPPTPVKYQRWASHAENDDVVIPTFEFTPATLDATNDFYDASPLGATDFDPFRLPLQPALSTLQPTVTISPGLPSVEEALYNLGNESLGSARQQLSRTVVRLCELPSALPVVSYRIPSTWRDCAGSVAVGESAVVETWCDSVENEEVEDVASVARGIVEVVEEGVYGTFFDGDDDVAGEFEDADEAFMMESVDEDDGELENVERTDSDLHFGDVLDLFPSPEALAAASPSFPHLPSLHSVAVTSVASSTNVSARRASPDEDEAREQAFDAEIQRCLRLLPLRPRSRGPKRMQPRAYQPRELKRCRHAVDVGQVGKKMRQRSREMQKLGLNPKQKLFSTRANDIVEEV